MASGDKSTKTQILALYKLEFYKNKKNWKLYEDVSKEAPPSSKKPNKLNKTYNVGKEFPEPDYDVHNTAFLGDEPEDAPDPQPPDEPPPLPAPEHNLYRPHSWPQHPWSEDKTEALWQGDAQQNGAGAEPWNMPEQLAYDQCDGLGHQNNLWTPAPQLELRPTADSLDQLLQSAEDWMLRHGYPLRQQCPADDEFGLVDEIADFMRGAHEASHSSEIDLSVTPDCPCIQDGLLYMLSERQLAQAVRRHHFALVHLLGEQALRERPYSSSHLHYPIPFEDCPTRDTDLFGPDVVLSGSHVVPGVHAVSGLQSTVSSLPHGAVSNVLQVPVTGRGRGRLQQTHRVIGIGMGRPYRL